MVNLTSLPTAAATTGKRRPRVLLVEDSYLIGEMLRGMLESYGYDVNGPYSTCAQASIAMREGEHDCAVLDIRLRDTMAFAIARELRDRGRTVVFATGYRASVIPRDLRDIPRLGKPVEARELDQALGCLPRSNARSASAAVSAGSGA